MTKFSADWSRRNFLRGALATGALVLPGSSALVGCATSGGGQESTEGEKTDQNPLGVPTDSPLEVYIFNGGFGDKYATDVHEPMYNEKYPKAKINHKAEVDIASALQSRFVGGNPPDFVNDSGDGQIPLGQLVSDKQLYDLDRPVRRAELGRPGHEGPRHARAGRDRAGHVRRQALRHEHGADGLRHLVQQGALRREGLGAARDVGRHAHALRGDQGGRHRAVDLPGRARPVHELAAALDGRASSAARTWSRRSTTSRKAPGSTRRSRSRPTRWRACARRVTSCPAPRAWTTSRPRASGARARPRSCRVARGWRTSRRTRPRPPASSSP